MADQHSLNYPPSFLFCYLGRLLRSPCLLTFSEEAASSDDVRKPTQHSTDDEKDGSSGDSDDESSDAETKPVKKMKKKEGQVQVKRGKGNDES